MTDELVSLVIDEAREKMTKAVAHARQEFAGIRTGRATPGMFNKLLVDYYGAPTPLQQLASFQTPEARTILISPFDKSAMHAIEKTLRDSDLGVNVTKRKVLNNIRSSTKEQFLTLKAVRVLSLDDAIEYISDDELVEVTPKSNRLRKRILDTQTRQRQEKRAKYAEAVV